ncbi:GNAT family N-acetyltransferase [Planctopirus hydrillae]|uniref:glucosamine-phosphate N-acetyltransferase n=1 Tax=Planctopirus hydrillae TaxID=1841610 RepID=A0A1C3ETH8_9PLAN|nr:GNAT family N-acetyltransferase [Planctopirus hydrillae]ODA36536.1 GCN5 family acetyltransferase [Planctopirus hydrillae]
MTVTPPPGLVVRLMDARDLQRGFLETLSVLKPTELSHEAAVSVFQRRLRSKVHTYVALLDNQVIGTASLMIEPKFLHGGSAVGHIEDVAVRQSEQHHGIGLALMKHLFEVCQQAGCYKVILDCAPDVAPFYEKLGFHQWALGYRVDLQIQPTA